MRSVRGGILGVMGGGRAAMAEGRNRMRSAEPIGDEVLIMNLLKGVESAGLSRNWDCHHGRREHI